jgi:hypothetical protein
MYDVTVLELSALISGLEEYAECNQSQIEHCDRRFKGQSLSKLDQRVMLESE